MSSIRFRASAKCIRGEEPVYELAHKIAQARGVRMEEVMFGKTLQHGVEVRRLLKQAEYEAFKIT